MKPTARRNICIRVVRKRTPSFCHTRARYLFAVPREFSCSEKITTRVGHRESRIRRRRFVSRLGDKLRDTLAVFEKKKKKNESSVVRPRKAVSGLGSAPKRPAESTWEVGNDVCSCPRVARAHFVPGGGAPSRFFVCRVPDGGVDDRAFSVSRSDRTRPPAIRRLSAPGEILRMSAAISSAEKTPADSLT